MNYTEGSTVRICSRERLEELSRGSKYHPKIEKRQFAFAGQIAMVKWSGIYHGGGFVYQLDGIPGFWHERLLEPACRSGG